MKKFIIKFDYLGFLFSAKVLVKREHGKTIISTTVIDNQLTFLLNGTLMFVQEGKGFDLLLFKKDRSFEILNWNIKHQLVDKTQVVAIEAFSLS